MSSVKSATSSYCSDSRVGYNNNKLSRKNHVRLRYSYGKIAKILDVRYSFIKGYAIFVAHLSLIILVPYIFHKFSYGLGVYSIILAPFIMLFVATRFRALGNIIHECSHNTYFRSRSANKFLGNIIAIIDFTDFSDYRREHGSHHKYLGDFDKDMDFGPKERFNFEETLDTYTLMRHVIYPFSLLHLRVYNKLNISNINPFTLNGVFRIVYLSILIYVTFLFSKYMILFFWVPFAVIYPAILYWTDAIDHAGLIPNEDELYASRNFLVEFALVRWLLFPRNDCYHLIHHLFPGVSPAAFPALHKALMQDTAYRNLNHSVAEKVRALSSRSHLPARDR